MRKFILLLISINVFSAVAQQKAMVLEKTEHDSISIHADIRDVNTRYIIDTIILSGNEKTRDHIIFRELTFDTGDTLNATSLAPGLRKSRDNLLNTSLFNFVTITDSLIPHVEMTRLAIRISFVERWYIWPFPIFEISGRNLNTWWKDKEFDRVNYGFFLTKENCRGRMETLRLLLRFGYDERYVLSYEMPYINKEQTFGAGFGVGWTQNHEVAYRSSDNKLDYIEDENQILYRNTFSYFNITHRPTLYHHHMLQLNYNFFEFGDTVLQLNPDYSFGGQKTNEFLTLSYSYTSDHRDSKTYPLVGNYLTGSLTKSGFGILKNGDIGMMHLKGSYRKYWKLAPRFFFSTDWTGKISVVRDQPYFYQRGLGFERDFVRGYELYVIDGQSFALTKNTFKFNLIPTQVTEIGFINFEKFSKIHYTLYLNWFVDAGYVEDYRNFGDDSLENSLLIGTGLGLDLVTYYDIVFRVEASVNKLGEIGVFVHLKNTL